VEVRDHGEGGMNLEVVMEGLVKLLVDVESVIHWMSRGEGEIIIRNTLKFPKEQEGRGE
jgi:hypothetical protein